MKAAQCKRGHPFTDDNVETQRRSNGSTYRRCKICLREGQRRRYGALTMEQKRERRARFPSTQKMNRYAQRHRFETKYGITVAAAKAVLVEQDGLCAICYDEPATHLDHDHATGDVRGWLCAGCNWGLGHFKERRETFYSALAYLEGAYR